VTSDAAARSRQDDGSAPTRGTDSTDTGASDIETTDSAATTAREAEPAADETTDEQASAESAAAARRRRRQERAAARASVAEDAEAEQPAQRSRSGGPLVPVLSVLLLLLLAGAGFLWFTRPATSSIKTTDYVSVLEAARSGVVDLTSFDYLTLDDDLRQIKNVSTGDLRKESTDTLNKNRKTITDSQAVVSTKIIGAGVTKADSSNGTVVLVIETTQKSKASTQAQVTRYRIEVQMTKVGGRWLLSGITGR
jgi:Mce-associated membrane protein